MRHLPFIAAAVVFPIYGFQLGQSAREQALGRAARETQVRVGLDRSEYFPGEEVVVKARVVNESMATIEVPDPEDHHLRFNVERFRGDRPDKPEQVTGPQMASIAPRSKSVLLRPLEEREYAVNLSDPRCFDRWYLGPPVTVCVPTFVPGRYVLKATLGSGGRGHGPEARFSVITPNLYLWQRAMLNRFFTIPPQMLRGVPPGMVAPKRLFVPVAAVEYNGEHSVLIRRNAGHFWKEPAAGPFVAESPGPFAPYFRAATLRHRIVSLVAAIDAAENLTVTFSDSSGATRMLRFDKEGNPIREK